MKKQRNLRSMAAQAVEQVVEQGQSLSNILPPLQQKVSDKDPLDSRQRSTAMRMWMLPPETMCRKHLLGEHVELHMLLGSLRRGKNIDGFLAGKLVDPRRMFRRHEELVLEMERRGYRHASPLDEAECETLARRYGHTGTGIDAGANAAELARRCPECEKRLRRP